MTTVNVHDAKTHFSKYLDRVLKGEEIVVSRYGKPLVKLMPVTPAQKSQLERKPGILQGREFWVTDDFDETPPAVHEALLEDIDAHTS